MGCTQDRIYTLLIRPSKYYQIIFPFSASLELPLSACQYFILQLPREQIRKHIMSTVRKFSLLSSNKEINNEMLRVLS